MGALKILIVEDDLILAEQIADDLAEIGYIITDIVSNSDDALKAYKRRVPDLVVMDINLGTESLDGIEIAIKFNCLVKVPIIFLTGIGGDETVVRANKVKPAYYLIKPYNEIQLKASIYFAIENFTLDKEADVNHSLQFHNVPKCAIYSSNDFFFTKIESKFHRIDISELIYVKAESPGNYIRIVTEKINIVQSLGLKSFTTQIQHEALVRVSRSYIVNMHKILTINGTKVVVDVNNNKVQIPIGPTYRNQFQKIVPKLKSD